MDTGVGHRAQRGDGSGQLAFQAALVVDLLGELTDTEGLILHQFEADVATVGQALFGKLQAQGVQLVVRHHQGVAAGGKAIRHPAAIEFGDDGAAVGFAEIAEQDSVLWARGPHHQGDDQSNRGGAPDHQGNQGFAA